MSSEAGPTPGPWSVGNKDCFDDVVVIPTNEPMRTVAVALHFEKGREDNNASLIAAAPDLLEAASRVLDKFRRTDQRVTHEQQMALTQLLRAEAKAEGRES